MLEAVNVACVRGDRPLFSGLSFTLEPGDLLHVVGANGRGKTTLLRTVCGLTHPAEGEIRWNGTPIRATGDAYLSELLYVGHLNGIQYELTLVENLQALACLSGAADRDRCTDALARMGLAAYRDFPAKILSQGQKRRLALARLLVLRRKLWVLDEPLSALDVATTEMMTELFAEHLKADGMILLTSHQELAGELVGVVQISLDL
jgi:heme exporter protein A